MYRRQEAPKRDERPLSRCHRGTRMAMDRRRDAGYSGCGCEADAARAPGLTLSVAHGGCARLSRRAFLVGLSGVPAGAGAGPVTAAGPDATDSGREGGTMVVNIRDFGARGDGSRDDTDAFRAMHRRLLSAQQANPECW